LLYKLPAKKEDMYNNISFCIKIPTAKITKEE
jgi:hypothetical protein